MKSSLLKDFDWVLFWCMVILISFGILVIYSTSVGDVEGTSDFYKKQIISAFLGLLLFFLASRIDYKILGAFSPIIFVVSILFLIITMVVGLETRGSTRWLDVAGVRLQPSELAKPALIIFLASFFNKFKPNSLRSFLLSLVVLSLPLGLIFKQPDLGNAIVVFSIWFFVVFASGARLIHLGSLIALFTLAIPFLWNFLKDYQKERIVSFLNPQADPLGSGYNLIQAVIAVGSGQITGRGFGRGTQSHLNFLPEKHTDFIFASLAEELGFIGGFLLLVVFGILIFRLIKISQKAFDSEGALIAVGITVMILTQIFVNIGMNMGLMPITGITLPFVSFGGSSLVSLMISLGIMQSIFRFRKEDIVEIK